MSWPNYRSCSQPGLICSNTFMCWLDKLWLFWLFQIILVVAPPILVCSLVMITLHSSWSLWWSLMMMMMIQSLMISVSCEVTWGRESRVVRSALCHRLHTTDGSETVIWRHTPTLATITASHHSSLLLNR